MGPSWEGLTLKRCTLFSLPHIRDVDYGNIQKSYSCFCFLLCYTALQSLVSLQATASLLPGLPLSPQQGVSGAAVCTLQWYVLNKHYSGNYNNTLELSQSSCSNACVHRGRKEKLQLVSISPTQENDCCNVRIASSLLLSPVSDFKMLTEVIGRPLIL